MEARAVNRAHQTPVLLLRISCRERCASPWQPWPRMLRAGYPKWGGDWEATLALSPLPQCHPLAQHLLRH